MKDKISNFFNGSYRLLCIVMVVLFGVIVISTMTYLIPSTSISSVLIITIGTIIYLLFLAFLYRKFAKLKPKTHDKIAIVISIVSFLVLILWGLTHRSLNPYDLNYVIDEVKVLLNNNSHNVGNFYYFSKYPHQIPIFILIYTIESFGKTLFNAPEGTMIIFNCAMIALSFFTVYKILKEIKNSNVGLIGLIICVLYLDFYMYASYYYTNVLCIPFAVFGLYLLLRAEKYEKLKKYLLLFLGGIFFAIAIKIRVVASFILIAYIIDLLLKTKYKDLLKNGVVIIIAILGVSFINNYLSNNYFNIKLNENSKYPTLYYIMTGLNQSSDGTYNGTDANYIQSSKNKNEAALKVINERIKTINLDFFVRKLATGWAGGKHYENNFYLNINKVDDSYSFLVAENSIFINFILQIMTVSIYILFLITILNELKNKNNINKSKVSVFIITIFGAILFYLIWETRNRYSMPFIEWLIIAGSLSITNIDLFLKNKLNNIQKENSKKLGIIILILTTILLIDGFMEYAYKEDFIDIRRYSQYFGVSYIDLKDNEIEQYFTVDDNFNKIEVAFSGENITKKISYKFELYNMNNELIYEKKFNSTNKKGPIAKIFEFKNIIVEKPTKYYFKIYSDEATEDNYLKFLVFTENNCYNKDYDYQNQGLDLMPNGETYLNNKKICPELTMKVYEHKISNKMRKKYYIAYSLIIILVTYLGIKEVFLKKSKKDK